MERDPLHGRSEVAITNRRIGLSKSRITLFEQCPRRLWLSVHRPELAEEKPGIMAAFSAGYRIGELACSLHPDGIMISDEQGLGVAIEQTSRLLRQGWDKPIFEATFAHDGVLIRADILLPREEGWHLAEVKNTTRVKEYHLGDLATQVWVMRASGVPVASAAVRHLDTTFTLTADGNLDGLFADARVDHLIEPIAAGRAQVVSSAREVLAADEPAIEPGSHCSEPFSCSFTAHCGRHLPPSPEWPVTLLPDQSGKKVARQWLEQGVADLTSIPAEAMPSAKLRRIHQATITGKPWHDAKAIIAETASWAYPRTFLDFETIQLAVPRWLGTRPYSQVPFQFSAHIEAEGGALTQAEYLSIDGSDPRRGCAEALAMLPEIGSVIAWNMAFERSCLLGLAERFADLAPRLIGLADRLVDLLPVVRRHYYHRDMRGSWSIKAVLPTLSAIGYDDLIDVKSGTDAQAAYSEAIARETRPERRLALRDALLEYCRRDTQAMMLVLGVLATVEHPDTHTGP